MSGRYTLLGSIAKGGMARVYLARMSGSAGFSRLVAIKRLHPELAAEREFVAMLVDEARLAAQLRHTNIVSTLDLVASDGAFSLVLDYVEGLSLSGLWRLAIDRKEPIPRPIAIAILYGVLRGLDAAHEARNEEGHPLGIVHRDVSPQNVLVGIDGISRVIDFGVAKAMGRFESTKPGEVRGKFAYMAPEQLMGRPVTRQVDVYAAGVVLWELLTGARLFSGDDQRAVCAAVMRGEIPAPSTKDPAIPRELDEIVARATARDVSDRYLTAREMSSALEACETASDDEVGAWVRRLAAKTLHERQRMIQAVPATAAGRSIEDLMSDLARTRGPQDTTPDGAAAGTPSFAPVPSGFASASAPVPFGEPSGAPILGRAPSSGSGIEIVAPRPAHRSSTRRLVVYAAALGFAAFVLVAVTVSRARRAPQAVTPDVHTAERAVASGAMPATAPPDTPDDEEPSVPEIPSAAFTEPPLELDPPSGRSAPTSTETRPPKKRVRPRSPGSSSTTPDPKSYR